VFKFLGEWGGMLQNLAGIGSRYLPYAIWNARTFQDEGFVHFEAGRKVLESYAADESQVPRLRTAVAKWYPLCIDMFGSAESPNDAKCLEYGIKTLSNRELREAWLDGALPTLFQYDLVPADPLLGKRQRYDEHEAQVDALVARSGTKVSA
jgi:1,2-phenylacetyl-CoA epoxidase catalytic subunit